MELSFVDWAIIAIVLLSSLFSIISGFIKECLSLINWFCAFAAAKFFYYELSQASFLEGLSENLRIPLSIVCLFLVSFIIGAIIIHMVIGILRKTDGTISVTDRLLGFCFGALRGVMIVCALLAVCNLLFSTGIFSFVRDMPFWSESLFIPELNKVVFWFFDKIDMSSLMESAVHNMVSPDVVDAAAQTATVVGPEDAQAIAPQIDIEK